MERWPPDPGSSPGVPKKRKPMKRLQKSTPGEEPRERKGVAGRNVLEKWLQKERKGPEALETSLGPGKTKAEPEPRRR